MHGFERRLRKRKKALHSSLCVQSVIVHRSKLTHNSLTLTTRISIVDNDAAILFQLSELWHHTRHPLSRVCNFQFLRDLRIVRVKIGLQNSDWLASAYMHETSRNRFGLWKLIDLLVSRRDRDLVSPFAARDKVTYVVLQSAGVRPLAIRISCLRRRLVYHIAPNLCRSILLE